MALGEGLVGSAETEAADARSRDAGPSPGGEAHPQSHEATSATRAAASFGGFIVRSCWVRKPITAVRAITMARSTVGP